MKERMQVGWKEEKQSITRLILAMIGLNSNQVLSIPHDYMNKNVL